MRPARLAWVLCLTALAAGCAPALHTRVLEPAPVNLGAVRTLSVLQTEGKPYARRFMLRELEEKVRDQGFFDLRNRTSEGFQVRASGDRVAVYGGPGPARAPEEIGLRIDVVRWDSDQHTDSTQETDSEGKPVTKEEVHYTADVTLEVTAFDERGHAILVAKPYKGWFDSSVGDFALDYAVDEAVNHFLEDITPRFVRHAIRLDDEDAAQKPILDLARADELPRAIKQLRAYLAQHPTEPSAHYNLAAMLDSAGRYPEALEQYDRAIALSAKDFYAEMRADCARRQADAQALAQGPR